LDEQRRLTREQIVGISAETVTNIPSTDFPGHWPGESHEWSLEKFQRVRRMAEKAFLAGRRAAG
jgi:DNA-directed RNA polymerase I and III subunit RPAC1